MTIGKYGYDTSLGPNPDFLVSKIWISIFYSKFDRIINFAHLII